MKKLIFAIFLAFATYTQADEPKITTINEARLILRNAQNISDTQVDEINVVIEKEVQRTNLSVEEVSDLLQMSVEYFNRDPIDSIYDWIRALKRNDEVIFDKAYKNVLTKLSKKDKAELQQAIKTSKKQDENGGPG